MNESKSQIINIEEIQSMLGNQDPGIVFEVQNSKYNKSKNILNLEILTSFNVPNSIEQLITNKIHKVLSSCRVVFHYTFINIDKQEKSNSEIIYGNMISETGINLSQLDQDNTKSAITVCGKVFNITDYPLKDNKEKRFIAIDICEYSHGLRLKFFDTVESYKSIRNNLSVGDYIKTQGQLEYDKYEKCYLLRPSGIVKIQEPMREDNCSLGKRVELHAHTKMSDSDGLNEIDEMIKTSAHWGQSAIAITDHGVVQAFPEAAKVAAKLKKSGQDIKIIYGVEAYLYPDEDAILPDGSIDIKKNSTYHSIILVQNEVGLRNLYRLVSMSHLDYFYKKPRMPRSLINKYREGLIVGSACEAGEVYRAVLNNKPEDEILKIAEFYDYLEIQPLDNNRFMVKDGTLSSDQDLIDINKRIVSIGDMLGKLTVATTDSHYANRESAIYRNIIMSVIGFTENGTDGLYLRTTDEMMEEFSYLGERAKEIVIDNTNKIADMIEEISPVHADNFPPHIEGAEETLVTSVMERAKSLYGDPLPQDIQERLDTELSFIVPKGYAVMYMAAKLLVEKSNQDGYLVGSRGSVGSSLVATMAGITEVNPLPPHYICPGCHEYEPYQGEQLIDCGFDLPDKNCPKCGKPFHKDGINIPFATFLGFTGDKEPDIDLNFAGEYQTTAQKYVGEIFGYDNVFKAGTVSTIADNTAYGYVRKYMEERGESFGKYDIEALKFGCVGVKKTTGQHPGGIIVVPDDHEIYEFCPVQYPANKSDSEFITTHFDYHQIEHNLLKLDILGHDAPGLLRHLQTMTGVDPMSIPLDDAKTLELFTSLKPLDIKIKNYKIKHGTLAIPEFGTRFTRQMLDDIEPRTISALIKMAGLAHGTGVWKGNAQDLILNKTASVDEIITTRDDIMNYLISLGMENSRAFSIMEKVRKNKSLSAEDVSLMKKHGVPDWYLKSCETLEYLFPRAHAAAYVMMSLRLAWFKINHPLEFYAAYLTSKIANFDLELALSSAAVIEKAAVSSENTDSNSTLNQKNESSINEILYEMSARGIRVTAPSLDFSLASKFDIIDGKLIAPFTAISGIGDAAAVSLYEELRVKPFNSIEDIKRRTKLTSANIESLVHFGVLVGLPDQSQVSLFDMI